MDRAVFVAILLSIPLAFASESVPEFPALYWGEINAPCSLSGLTVKVMVNSNVLDTILVSSASSSLYAFGGPGYVDDKLIVSGLNDGTTISFYIFNGEFNILLGTEDFNAGEIKALYFSLSDANCSTLFPPAKYSGEISAPCNVSGMTVKAYASTEYLGSSTVSGSSSPFTFSAITVDPLSSNVSSGTTITFKLYSSANSVTLGTEYFSYGEEKTISFALSSTDCNVLFGTAETMEEQTTGGMEGNTTTTTTSENEQQTTQESTEPGTVTIKNTTTTTSQQSKEEQMQETEDNTAEPVDVVEGGGVRIFGMPLDVAIIAAIVVIIVVVLFVRLVV